MSKEGGLAHYSLLLLSNLGIRFKSQEKDFTFVAQYILSRVVVGYRMIKSEDFLCNKIAGL